MTTTTTSTDSATYCLEERADEYKAARAGRKSTGASSVLLEDAAQEAGEAAASAEELRT